MLAGLAKQLLTVKPKTLVYWCVARLGMDSSWETETRRAVEDGWSFLVRCLAAVEAAVEASMLALLIEIYQMLLRHLERRQEYRRCSFSRDDAA
eukprot:4895751-Ditylum_brightwellii.AAC.1